MAMDIASHLPEAGPGADMSRVLDYWLGGKRAYKADRDLAARLEQVCASGGPTLAELAARDRVYVVRAIQDAADAGIRQAIVISAGYPGTYRSPWPAVPSLPPPHEAAPGIRAVYVKGDPQAYSVVRGMLDGAGNAEAVAADPCDPEMALELAAGHLDLSQPAVLVASRAFVFLDVDQAAGTAAGWMGGLAPGSRMVATVTHCPDEATWRKVRTLVPVARNHSDTDLRLIFAAAKTLLEGGDVQIARGWGPERVKLPEMATRILAGTGWKV